MADVTISSLPIGTPSGYAVLPFSQSNVTSQTSLSSLYSNTILTNPVKPAFMVQAGGSDSYIHPANTIIRLLTYTVKIFDIGNNFNTSLSRFTAPIDGIYCFSGMLRTNPSPSGWLYPAFKINDVQYGNGTLPGLTQNNNPNSAGFGTANFHLLMKLNKSDFVDIYFGAGSAGTYLIDGQSVWYGYLVG